MTIGAVFVTLMLLRSTTLSSPHDVAAVVSPVQGCAGTPFTYGGVPATYIVEPSTRASLPAHCEFGPGEQTGTLVPSAFVVKSNCCTLACVPPHSAPQFNT